MIENQFIPLSIARQLVNLGFNEDCFGEYFTDGTISFTSGKNTFHEAVRLNKVIACIAPTFYDTFKWFREKHSLLSFITPKQEGFMFTILNINTKTNLTQFDDLLNGGIGKGGGIIYLNYRGCEIACIEYMIKLVKDGTNS